MMAFIVPLIACLLGGVAGYILRRMRLFVMLIGAAVALTGALGWLLIAAQMATNGWDGIGYAIGAVLMAAPGLIGLGIGAALAWRRSLK